MFCRNVHTENSVQTALVDQTNKTKILYGSSAQALHGAPWCHAVICGNALVESIATVILPLALWLGLLPVIEQPQGSLMWEWPSLKALIHQWIPIRVTLGTFGALSQKNLYFVGLWEGLHILQKIWVELAVKINPPRGLESQKLTKKSGRREKPEFGLMYTICLVI